MRLLSYTKGGKHLGVVDVYTKIPYDLSGSISKNRFRQELCWGISKMFDLFDKEDFCVVFDYKCDIEIHFNDSIETSLDKGTQRKTTENELPSLTQCTA